MIALARAGMDAGAIGLSMAAYAPGLREDRRARRAREGRGGGRRVFESHIET